MTERNTHTMFEKAIHLILPAVLLAAFGISAATETPAAEPKAPAEIAYLCQLPNGQSVRTALPQGRCRPVRADSQTAEASAPAAPPAATVAIPNGRPAKEQADNGELPAVWQEAVAAASDVQLAQPVPMRVTLRQQPMRPAAAVIRPAPVIAAAKPLTPKEIITRDIRREERALAQAERELASARRHNQPSRADSLQIQIADRRSGLHSLRQELRRHQ
ncbi:hypothetical protein H9Q10_01795 [Eikenella sp. S3360]|uniref:DUF4124 domain-containing protein n=1 Tax=Eikenella glucosivorans TaxID=2766967 RepID=A0ABS0N819_9NEIS|nr:hypothetical protein [Eikenella glucosivorans]MBH5328404.1 hypothetical protein [Eikenella glucosivorans]